MRRLRGDMNFAQQSEQSVMSGSNSAAKRTATIRSVLWTERLMNSAPITAGINNPHYAEDSRPQLMSHAT